MTLRPDATALADAALVRAARGGDRPAFEELYRRYAAWLLARLRRRCADADLVEEVVQETFVAVWRGTARYRGGTDDEVAGWLWRIGIRRLIEAQRGGSRRVRLFGRLLSRRGADEPSAEERVLAGVEHGDLAGALARLSPELRAVIQATVLDGLTTAEASQLLGIPPGTVKTRASRARRALREELA